MNKSQFIQQHSITAIKKWLDGVFEYSSVKFGESKKGQGDIVVVNLKGPDWLDIKEYLEHTHLVDRIEVAGIYTNIFWSRNFFTLVINFINKT